MRMGQRQNFWCCKNIEEGGSLTIISTALITRAVEWMKLFLRNLREQVIVKLYLIENSDKRIYPAIDITKSGTREELLFDKNDLQKMNVLRRIIAPMGTMDAIEFISSKLKDTKIILSFNSMNKPA